MNTFEIPCKKKSTLQNQCLQTISTLQGTFPLNIAATTEGLAATTNILCILKLPSNF